MSSRKKLTIRAAQAKDFPVWKKMWKQYCDFYEAKVPEKITRATWKRILDPKQAVYGLVALDATGSPVGFANYVVHPFTWDTRQACYLEDLFVDPVARGQKVGQALIQALLDLCKKKNWARLYWHTNQDNYRARTLYDRFTPCDHYVRYRIML